MRHWLKAAAVGAALAGAAGCAYLGLHGPSIHRHGDVHAGVTADSQCLRCHHPDGDGPGPATPHPNLSGCLKCHSDPVADQPR